MAAKKKTKKTAPAPARETEPLVRVHVESATRLTIHASEGSLALDPDEARAVFKGLRLAIEGPERPSRQLGDSWIS